jgi:uncharacterized protein (DUF2249 family)
MPLLARAFSSLLVTYRPIASPLPPLNGLFMTTATSTDFRSTVDVRHLAASEREPLIFSTFKQLATGQSMELVSDHDQKPLHQQFQAELSGKFVWEYLEQGPASWRVAITRLPSGCGTGQCCGGCGNA